MFVEQGPQGGVPVAEILRDRGVQNPAQLDRRRARTVTRGPGRVTAASSSDGIVI